MNRRHRVAVTGVGVRTPAGNDVTSLIDTLLGGRSVASTVPGLVEGGSPTTFACTVPIFDTSRYCTVRELRQMERPTVMALAAAVDAVDQAGFDSPSSRECIGVAVGTALGGLSTAERIVRDHSGEPDRVPPTAVPRIMANSSAAKISLRLGTHAPCLTYSMACASGAVAIGESTLKIRSGALDVVVAGGVDSCITPMVMSSFARMAALSRRNDDPTAASRPFDKSRDGFVMGEGAAFMVLERWDRAISRGASILGEVAGYASNSDAHHLVAPPEHGAVAAECMRSAINDARLSTSDIGHINAHGTSTQLNDRAEAQAIAHCFDRQSPPVTAPKGVIGHSMGAAGAIDAIVSLHVANTGIVPQTANFTDNQEEAALIDIVANKSRKITPSTALSNCFGFGGHNACLVLAPGPS